jgi:cytoskeletal protein RodZ
MLLAAFVVVLVVLGFLIMVNGLFGSKPAANSTAPSATSSASKSATASASPTAAPTVAPTVDPKSPVDVLNGTDTGGLAGTMATRLANAGWTIGTKGNADNVATTKVYYSNAALKGAALGVVQSLGFGTAVQSDAYANAASPITVVLGADAK